jgi:hypothetical protein
MGSPLIEVVFFPMFVIHLFPAAWAVLVGRIAVVPAKERGMR